MTQYMYTDLNLMYTGIPGIVYAYTSNQFKRFVLKIGIKT